MKSKRTLLVYKKYGVYWVYCTRWLFDSIEQSSYYRVGKVYIKLRSPIVYSIIIQRSV